MARNRNKVYQQGDRINIYLSRDLTPEFIEWINKQSDLSNFFLYAAQQLYQKTGFTDVSEVMPRKINFDIPSANEVQQSIVTEEVKKENTSEPLEALETNKDEKEEHWVNLSNLDDPFA